jgi:signal transduction histidine kinase
VAHEPIGAGQPNGNGRRTQKDASKRRRRVLWFGFAAALLPMALMVILQYLWLVDLEKNSSIAERMTYQKLLEATAKEAVSMYNRHAEKVLDVPTWFLRPENAAALAEHFCKKKLPLARRYFVLDYGAQSGLRVFDPSSSCFVMGEKSDETFAIWAAVSPYALTAKRGVPVTKQHVVVDERDPRHRIILFPLLDDAARLIGLSGLVIDLDVFEREVLPKAIEVAMPAKSKVDLVVWAIDNQGRVVWPRGATSIPKLVTARMLPFVFTDWKIGLQERGETPEKWARRNFTLNLTLFLLLAGVLLAGVALALRTAAREIHLCAMKNDFVSNVSHELRTPISSIRVFGELMRLGRVNDPAKVREYGGHIETESRRLTQLINNILDFSRIESGRKVYTFEESDVVRVVRDAVSTFDVRIRDKGFVVEVELPEQPLPPMRLDAGAIDQAICNLLDNAVKYSGDDRSIKVRLVPEGRGVVISVIDRGIGIPRDEQRRVFERFHRVSTGLVHDVRGVGLGLSIVQHIVQAHGGHVTVDSDVGKGSTFSIHLPGRGEDTADQREIGT